MSRCLVVRGGWDGHVPVEATEVVIPGLVERGFEVIVAESLEVYDDLEILCKADVVLQCWSMGTVTDAQLENVRTAVASGTGLAGWHGGIVDAFRVPGYLQLVGGQFVAHPGDFVTYQVDIVPERAEHEIVAGLASFSVHTEQYWVLTDPLDDVLATTTLSGGPGTPWRRPVAVPAVWTRSWGLGRVFVCTVGHRVADLEQPEILGLVERGIGWASRQ